MSTEQLIEHLNAVCDAEIVLYACDETISMYQAIRSDYAAQPVLPEPCPPPKEPIFPSAMVTAAFGKKFIIKKVIFELIPFIIIVPILCGYIARKYYDLFRPYMTIMVVLEIAWILSLIPRRNAAKERHIRSLKKAAETKNERKHQAVFAEYEAFLNEIRASNQELHTMYSASSEKIDLAIKRYEAIRSFARKNLDNFYAQELLEPAFRSIIPVFQIREYLLKGDCDNLEGNNGAYARYTTDVCADRISFSIDALKTGQIPNQNATQSTLQHELAQINQFLSAIGESIKSNLEAFRQIITDPPQLTRGALQDIVDQAGHHVTVITQNAFNSSYNAYLQQKCKCIEYYYGRN